MIKSSVLGRCRMLLQIILCFIFVVDLFCAYRFSNKFGQKGTKNTFQISRYGQQSGYDPSYLQRLVDRKKIEVNTLLRKHQDLDDPLVMRMSYMASQCKFNVTNSIKLGLGEKDGK